MKISKCKIAGVAVSFAVAGLIIVATNPRSAAQSTNSVSSTNATNVMSPYIDAVRQAIISDTAATNLTEAECSRLMNESIKTDLAAQLWFRQAMTGRASALGSKMSQEIRVLESLRAGRTKDAIRMLEENLDGDVINLATFLRLADESKSFKTTRGPIEAIQEAREYREKFPRKSGDAATDERVKESLSYQSVIK